MLITGLKSLNFFVQGGAIIALKEFTWRGSSAFKIFVEMHSKKHSYLSPNSNVHHWEYLYMELNAARRS
jgi:hypothetical protein